MNTPTTLLRRAFAAGLFAALAAGTLAAQPDFSQHTPLGNADDVTHAVALADLDGDGDLDVVLANGTDLNNPAAGANTIYLNDGNGNLVPSGELDPAVRGNTYALVVEDFDGDGDKDVFADGRIYTNDGSAVFAPAGMLGTASGDRLAVAGDLDNDGDADLVIRRTDHEVWLNDGAGGFTLKGTFAVSGDASGYALADFDASGDLDLAISTRDGLSIPGTPPPPADNQLWVGDGLGGFYPVGYVGSGGSSIVADDLDGDGDADLLIGVEGDSQLWENSGAWNFTSRGTLGANSAAYTVALADIDGDGDLDALLGNWKVNRLYLNNGGFNFSASSTFDGDWTWAVTAGDLDGDGDPDLVIGNGGQASFPQQNWVIYTNGQAGAAPAPMPNPPIGGTTGSGCVGAVDAGWGLALLPVLLLYRRRRAAVGSRARRG